MEHEYISQSQNHTKRQARSSVAASPPLPPVLARPLLTDSKLHCFPVCPAYACSVCVKVRVCVYTYFLIFPSHKSKYITYV